MGSELNRVKDLGERTRQERAARDESRGRNKTPTVEAFLNGIQDFTGLLTSYSVARSPEGGATLTISLPYDRPEDLSPGNGKDKTKKEATR